VALVAPDPGWFAVVFALSAAGTSGMGVAAWNLLYAVAPDADRPLYVGVANSVLALPSLAPIGVGLLVAPFGIPVAFVLAAAAAAFALAFSFRFVRLRDLDRAALARDAGRGTGRSDHR